MPRRIWTGAARPPGMQGKAITPEMARALTTLRTGSMERFRRGYALELCGPYFELGTIDGLWKRGLIDYSPVSKRAFATREGLKALAEWADDQSSLEVA